MNLADNQSKGSGPARNFAWAHSISNGYDWHWVMDDNIRSFKRFNHNQKIRVLDGTIFKCMEDFVLRYENIGMAGPHYTMFIPADRKHPPFILNTRIYSCNLIRNNLPFRWRGRYNEDTDLSLRILKSGLCTVLFKAFLQEKLPTQTVKGGNNTEIYADGTEKKSKMIKALHPDVVRLVMKYNRYHHHIDYSVFSKNKLIRKSDIEIEKKIDNYGLELINKNG